MAKWNHRHAMQYNTRPAEEEEGQDHQHWTIGLDVIRSEWLANNDITTALQLAHVATTPHHTAQHAD